MLTIEKVIKSLDDFHYKVFYEHVKQFSKRSFYPLALIDVIDRDIEKEQSTEFFCKAVYSDTSEKTKKKFFQLAHYTFQMTAFLSKNYPAYLQNNISRVQQLINSGQLKRANILLEIVMDVAKKKEDFDTEMQCCQIFIQQSRLTESTRSAMRYQLRVLELLKCKEDLNTLHTHFYTIYNLKEKENTSKSDIELGERYFKNYFDHYCILIRIISGYYYCFLLNFSRNKLFYEDATLDILEKTDLLLQKNQTLIFPYLFDLKHPLAYLRLKFWNDQGAVEKAHAYTLELLNDSSVMLYWKSFINSPEIAMLAIQTNMFAREHLYLVDCEQAEQNLTEEANQELLKINEKLEKFIDNDYLMDTYALRYINVCTLSALLALCGNQAMIQKAITRLNGVLVSFQQLPFHTGSIYSILGTAYFKLSDYEQVSINFKRYKKQMKNQNVHPVNDLTINAIYYISMWLSSGKKQYVKKFENIYQNTHSDTLLQDLNRRLSELIKAYKIPLSAQQK